MLALALHLDPIYDASSGAVFGRHLRDRCRGAPDIGQGARLESQAKEEHHSAASAYSLMGKSSRCQTSTRASANASIKPSS